MWAFSCAQGGVCSDGRSPEGGVVQARDGNLYGTTYGGGAYNDGTIYKITPAGVLTTLYNFCWYPNTCAPYSGGSPNAGLIQASDGDLYGTTTAGTAFKISPKGVFTLLYTWPAGGGSDGALMQVGTGNLYGTTAGGGANGKGTVFRMSLKGKVTTLYSFCSQPSCADGQQPVAGLVQGANGDLYGTTVNGGAGYGTVFKITTKGAFTSLVTFEAGTTPANPYAPLVLGTDGNLYGTTAYGGEPDYGFVFQIANDTLANAYPLTGENGCIGGHPYGALMQSTDGNFYGSDAGACADDGTLFQFANNLESFVQPIPAYGSAGAKIVIQGTNLTGATAVSFHGTAAKFKVVSASEITATVPAGASSGKIDVVTPGGTLASNMKFKVLP
jgi:uncharacterized repeat protein (TIGR03803 family)